MYLTKAKKNFEQLDQNELLAKREKYVEQRVYSATSKAADTETEAVQLRGPVGGSRTKSSGEFKPEDLPDGACFRPKSVLTNGKGDQTAIRTAEYIGSFSVQGNDQASRTEYVRKQLEQMRNSTERKTVLLVISVTGIKVCSENGESVHMAHALKRISYASCDPEHWQFSFLAREPKGHINVQFCHAFQSSTADQAEELNTIVGNAFKMAYAQQHSKQPTFHELIEQQLEEQKVRYQEFQEEAQRSLAKRLEEISTPTPFSEKAMQRMELRRRSSGGSTEETTPNGKEKDLQVDKQTAKQKAWAKNLGRVKHKGGIFEGGPASPRASPPPLMKLLSDPGPSPSSSESNQSSPSRPDPARRHSQSPSSAAATSSIEGFHAPSVAAIRESLENQNNNSRNSKNKVKGSPVTALKETIDRQYNSSESPPETLLEKPPPQPPPPLDATFAVEPENYLYPVCHSHTKPPAPPESVNRHSPAKNQSPLLSTALVMSRPLPEIPPNGNSENNGLPRQRTSTQTNSSEEDGLIPAYQGQGHGKRRKERHKKGSSPSHVNHSSPSHQKGKITINGKTAVDIPWRETTKMDPTNGHVHVNANVYVQNKRDSEPIYATRSTQTFGESKPDKGGVYGARPSSVPTPQVIYGVKIGAPGSQLQEDIYDERYAIGPAASSSHPPRYQNDSPFHYHGTGDNSGASYETPVSPLRLDSLRNLDRSYIEDETLRHCSWYQPGIPREIALDILQQEEIGSFIVRDSTTHPGCYALSVKVPKFENPLGISHYLIRKSQRGVQLKGLDKEWPDLIALVTHHTVMPEMLPCTLRLPRNNKNPTFKASDKEDKEEDPDYQRLSDFSSMMAALKK